jgi:hypothetical protein
LPTDYTIGEKFRWGNSLVVIFVTQRSLLLGMPLTIIVLQKLWEIFCDNGTIGQWDNEKNPSVLPSHRPTVLSSFLTGLLAGTLPLIHVHSLVVLFVVSAFLFFFKLDRWRDWVAFGVGVSVLAIPELVWVMTGSATRLTEFVDWHFGWHKGEVNFFRFWLVNTGLFIPLLLTGIYMIFSLTARDSDNETMRQRDNEKSSRNNVLLSYRRAVALSLFSLPFFLLFFVSNTVKLAPWEWDNIKVLIYWFVGSLPIAAFVLAWLWNQDKILKVVAVGCLVVLTASGALDVWRTISRAIEYKVFDKDSVAIAGQIKQKTAPNALFLNAPTFNSAVVLSGRRSLMRYVGHLSSYGIDYGERETDVKRIYAGDATAEIFLKKYGIEYVLISPEEKSNLTVNEEFFRRFPVVAEVGQYRVYKVKN